MLQYANISVNIPLKILRYTFVAQRERDRNIVLENFRSPEIDQARTIQNRVEAIARTGNGVLVMFENGMLSFVRTITDVLEGDERVNRSETELLDGLASSRHRLTDIIRNPIRNLPLMG